MSKAYKEYYQRNRDEICAKMRERNKTRREEMRAEAFQTQQGAEAWREEQRERYYRGVESQITKQLKVWLEDPDICQQFKAFLRVCLWEHKGKLNKAFLRTLGDLSIANAFREPRIRPTEEGDGNQTEGSEEGEGSEGEAEGSEEGEEGNRAEV